MQFWYTISDSKREADGYTLTAAMMDGNTQRRATFQIKTAGDEVHVLTRRNPSAPITDVSARRVPAGEGAVNPSRSAPGRRPSPV
jgi:hypothetical protein